MISLNLKNTTFDFIYLFITVFVVNFLYLYLVNFIYNKPFVSEEDMSKLTLSTIVMYILVIPILEELCFRGILNLNRNIFLVSIAVSLVLLFYFKFTLMSLLIASLIIFFGILTIYYPIITLQVKSLVSKNPILFIISTSVAFSLIHLTNYDNIDSEAFLKIVPRFIGGLYLGYIAYKYGLSKSFLLHGLNNLIPFIIIFFIKYFKI